MALAVVESTQNENSNSATREIRQAQRQPKQNNFIYYPYFGYQSYYVVHRPTKQPTRRPTSQPSRKTTTQRYSIWDLSRKRRDVESDNLEISKKQQLPNDNREKRQINYFDVDYDYPTWSFPLFFGRRRNYAEKKDQPHSMWDLTRRK